MRYLIIGNGKLARHFSHYFSLLKLPFQQWSRQSSLAALELAVCNSDIILLLISDHAIVDFIAAHPFLQNKTLLHCSGCLVTPMAYSAHPLMSFSDQLFDLATYQQIPFILQDDGPDFAELLPGIKNPSYKIPSELKPYYHSLCVLANNFTHRLWQHFFKEMAERFHIPSEALLPYLATTFQNIQEQRAFTGPLARGDLTTIQQHLQALQNSPLLKLYQLLIENSL